MDKQALIRLVGDRATVLEAVKYNDSILDNILKAGFLIRSRLMEGKKLLAFGNGGSAAEAQHFVAELVCRYKLNRGRGFSAIALNDVSVITAQSNDFSFDTIFSRQIGALGVNGDIALAFTTSDANLTDEPHSHSRNIFEGLMCARSLEITTIGLVSNKTKNLLEYIDIPIIIPSEDTPIIQENHLMFIHFLCEIIDS